MWSLTHSLLTQNLYWRLHKPCMQLSCISDTLASTRFCNVLLDSHYSPCGSLLLWPLAPQPFWWPAGGTSHDTGCAPHNVIIVIWALMDFHYCIQAYCIMARDLNINAALCEFHLHKDSILDAGLCPGKANKPINNWHILKLELMQSIVPSILRAGVPI